MHAVRKKNLEIEYIDENILEWEVNRMNDSKISKKYVIFIIFFDYFLLTLSTSFYCYSFWVEYYIIWIKYVIT